MRTLYAEGSTVLHRVPARAKLIGLALAAVGLIMVGSLPVAALLLLVSTGVFASVRLGWVASWQRLRPVALTILVVGAFSFLVSPPVEAMVGIMRLVSLVLLAAAVTATTTTGEFIREITFAARPVERIGLVRAADIGLAVGLVLRFVPDVLERYHAIRAAHAARGLKPRVLTLAVPLIILTLKNADEVAAAIDARGIRGQKTDTRLEEMPK